MEFTRKKSRGRNQKTYKEWRSDCGHYRITWAVEVFGVTVEPHYYACYRACTRIGEMWDFVGRRGTYKTLKKAIEEAEKHRKLWAKFVELSNATGIGRRESRLAELNGRARQVFQGLPVWVQHSADPSLIRMQFPEPMPWADEDESDPSDDSPVSTTSDEASSATSSGTTDSETTETSGPAKSAAATASTTKKKTATATKATSLPPGIPATSAKPRAKAAKPSTKKTTSSPSKPTKPKSPSGEESKPSAKPASKSSRKKKE